MSRLPLEQMMASLRPSVAWSPKSGTVIGIVVVMSAPLSPAPAGFRQAGDVRHLLGRLAGEQDEQLLARNSGQHRDPTRRGGLAVLGVVPAQEPDRLPVLVGELDPD